MMTRARKAITTFRRQFLMGLLITNLLASAFFAGMGLAHYTQAFTHEQVAMYCVKCR